MLLHWLGVDSTLDTMDCVPLANKHRLVLDVGCALRRLCCSQRSAPLDLQLPSEADVVVIGGGSIGASTLYHLAQQGITNTVLVEKDQLTAGTTVSAVQHHHHLQSSAIANTPPASLVQWHSAGLLWRLRPSSTDIELIAHSRDMAKSLEEETGVSTGWVENGGMFIANNAERLDEYIRMQTLGKLCVVPVCMCVYACSGGSLPLLSPSTSIKHSCAPVMASSPTCFRQLKPRTSTPSSTLTTCMACCTHQGMAPLTPMA